MQTLKKIPYITSLALLAYMPFHIFLSQWLSLSTGGLEAWKIGKDVVLLLVVLFTICLVWQQGKMDKAFKRLVIFTLGYGSLHVFLRRVHPSIYRLSAELGIIYNMRLPMLAILGYGSVVLLPQFVFSSIMKLVLSVS